LSFAANPNSSNIANLVLKEKTGSTLALRNHEGPCVDQKFLSKIFLIECECAILLFENLTIIFPGAFDAPGK